MLPSYRSAGLPGAKIPTLNSARCVSAAALSGSSGAHWRRRRPSWRSNFKRVNPGARSFGSLVVSSYDPSFVAFRPIVFPDCEVRRMSPATPAVRQARQRASAALPAEAESTSMRASTSGPCSETQPASTILREDSPWRRLALREVDPRGIRIHRPPRGRGART